VAFQQLLHSSLIYQHLKNLLQQAIVYPFVAMQACRRAMLWYKDALGLLIFQRRCIFHCCAFIHYQHIIGNGGGQRQVVRDEYHCGIMLLLQDVHQLYYLLLHGYIERGSRARLLSAAQGGCT